MADVMRMLGLHLHYQLEDEAVKEPESFECKCGKVLTVMIDEKEQAVVKCPSCGKQYLVELQFKAA